MSSNKVVEMCPTYKKAENQFDTTLSSTIPVDACFQAGNVYVENLDGWDMILSSLSAAVSVVFLRMKNTASPLSLSPGLDTVIPKDWRYLSPSV